MTESRRSVAVYVLAASLVAIGAALVQAPAADPADLPPEVRESVTVPDLDWSAWQDRLRDVAEAAPSAVDPAPLWVNFLAELLIEGGVSVEDWRSLLEQRHIGLEGVCAIWQQFQFRDPDTAEQMGWVKAFWEAAMALLPEEQRDPATLPFDLALHLGEIQFWAGDIAGAKQTYEAVLNRLPEGPTDGRACRGLMAYRIAQCLERAFDIRGAREWYLKAADWGSPQQTGGYDLRGEALVEAARMCRGLGRHAEADGYYKRALNGTTGWGQAVAALDLARRAINQGDDDEADRILRESADLCGGGWGSGKILMHLVQRAYARGDREATLEYAQRVMQQLAGAEWPPAQVLATAAGDVIDRIYRWDDQPLDVSPAELRLQTGQDAQFVVTTWQEPPIQVTTDVPGVDIRMSEQSPKKRGEVRRTFEVSLKADASPGTYEGKVVLTTTRARPLEVPITVTVPAP